MSYINETIELMKTNNGSLTSNSLTASIARNTTLHVFRQLDPKRNSRIIGFLYRTEQVTANGQHPLLGYFNSEASWYRF